MAKISRPVLYTIVLGAAAYAVVVLTEPAPPPKKKVVHTATKPAAKTDDISPEDLKAHFPRYVSQKAHDPFTPGVVTVHALNAMAAQQAAGDKSRPIVPANWVLTGITAINGTKSALVENSGSGDSVFLKAGDQWNGMHVTQVGDVSVVLIGPNGQQVSLGFPEPPDPDKPNTPKPPGTNSPGTPAAPNAAPTTAPVTPPGRLASAPAGGVNGI